MFNRTINTGWVCPDLVIEQVLMWPVENQGKLTQGRGITESVRTIHINSIHQCSAVKEVMVKLRNVKRMTDEQHLECKVCSKDMIMIPKYYYKFQIRNPLYFVNSSLWSLSSGLTASSYIELQHCWRTWANNSRNTDRYK